MIEKKVIQTYCIKNQVPELIAILKDSDTQDKYFSRYTDRFINRKKTTYDIENQQLVSVLHAFEDYYISVFYDRLSRKDAKNKLRKGICNVLKVNKRMMYFLDRYLKKLFEGEGYHYLGLTTSGYWGPYIWKKTEEKKYTVEIPSGKIDLSVFFMYDFVMNSWLDYISFGETGTGGWSKKHGLYCNYSKYKDKLDLPSFNISYLKHEAQHNVDIQNKEYSMSSTVLEYRAKLTELAYYPNIDLLKRFIEHAKNDKRLSHPLAQYWIVQDLSNLIFNEEYVSDIEQWEPKLTEVKQRCKELLIGMNRCKKNKITAAILYFIRTKLV